MAQFYTIIQFRIDGIKRRVRLSTEQKHSRKNTSTIDCIYPVDDSCSCWSALALVTAFSVKQRADFILSIAAVTHTYSKHSTFESRRILRRITMYRRLRGCWGWAHCLSSRRTDFSLCPRRQRWAAHPLPLPCRSNRHSRQQQQQIADDVFCRGSGRGGRKQREGQRGAEFAWRWEGAPSEWRQSRAPEVAAALAHTLATFFQ